MLCKMPLSYTEQLFSNYIEEFPRDRIRNKLLEIINKPKVMEDWIITEEFIRKVLDEIKILENVKVSKDSIHLVEEYYNNNKLLTLKATNSNLIELIKISTVMQVKADITYFGDEVLQYCGIVIDLNNIDTSNVTELNNTFIGYPETIWNYKVKLVDVNRWDISNVTSMIDTFKGIKFTNFYIKDWDTSSVITMKGTFQDIGIYDEESENCAGFCPDISKWDTSNVINITNLFKDSAYVPNILAWDISSVRYIDNAFKNANLNQDITKWKMKNANIINRIFKKKRLRIMGIET